jgi:hypothetical protein
VRLADGVGDLDLAAPGQAGSDDVLGDPAHRVGTRPVDLARVLAGERPATVAGHAAVGVDDDLASGEAGVAHRSTDDEPAGGVHQQPQPLGVDVHSGENRLDDVLADVRRQHRVDVDVFGVLRGDTTVSTRTGRSPSYSMVTWVLPSGRRYGITPLLRTSVSEADSRCASMIGKRHQLGRLVAGVAEHQALVAGALPVERVVRALVTLLVGVVDTLGDVGDWLPIDTDTPHDSPSKPFADES